MEHYSFKCQQQVQTMQCCNNTWEVLLLMGFPFPICNRATYLLNGTKPEINTASILLNSSAIYPHLLQSMHNFHCVNCVSKCFQMMPCNATSQGAPSNVPPGQGTYRASIFPDPQGEAWSACGCLLQPTMRTAAGRSCCLCWWVSSGSRWIPCPPGCWPSEYGPIRKSLLMLSKALLNKLRCLTALLPFEVVLSQSVKHRLLTWALCAALCRADSLKIYFELLGCLSYWQLFILPKHDQ